MLACSPSKTAMGGKNLPLSPFTSLLSAPWLSHQVQAVIWELFYLKNEAPSGAGARADLCKRSVPHKALSDELAASHIAQKLTVAHRRSVCIVSLGRPPSEFY